MPRLARGSAAGPPEMTPVRTGWSAFPQSTIQSEAQWEFAARGGHNGDET
jgi:hypothetical protein